MVGSFLALPLDYYSVIDPFANFLTHTNWDCFGSLSIQKG